MTEPRDERVSAAYRALGEEEPSPALDSAILAAARRRPQRWYGPLAAAAVLVLAVAVTVHMQLEQPDVAEPASSAKQATPPAAAPAEEVREAAKVASAPKVSKPAQTATRAEPVPFPAKEERAMAERQVPSAPRVAAPAPAPSAGLASRADAARDAAPRGSREGEVAAMAPQSAAAQPQALAKRAEAPAGPLAETPERELERIAEMRAQGRHDEADKALAEFRKRYPDYRIAEEMRVRVERR